MCRLCSVQLQYHLCILLSQIMIAWPSLDVDFRAWMLTLEPSWHTHPRFMQPCTTLCVCSPRHTANCLEQARYTTRPPTKLFVCRRRDTQFTPRTQCALRLLWRSQTVYILETSDWTTRIACLHFRCFNVICFTMEAVANITDYSKMFIGGLNWETTDRENTIQPLDPRGVCVY